MPVNFLSEAERSRLSQFPDAVSESDLIQYFTLTPDDQVQIKRQRRSENRLGFALQLCTLRYLGFCPDDSQPVPTEGRRVSSTTVADPSCIPDSLRTTHPNSD
jgi:Domain of unknown function (DUF4158)